MRALLSVAVIVETLLTLACSRSIAPTAPSAAPSTSTSTSVARNTTAQAGSASIEPPLAQLDLVSNDLDSVTFPLKCDFAAAIHIASVISGSSGGTR